ncbi:holo-ACP synthase [Treponema sp. OMZ 840]|uniref:holo-ACP synthase n=1 Tax=Treponema sp. OMZ 840 TaxID=244313 RepID=UPI003D89EF53
MITGCGIDIVNVERFSGWLENPPLVRRFFHPDESRYINAFGSQKAAESLAVRFAAKEAFGKALGTGLSGFKLSDICVDKDAAGKPVMRLSGAAAELLKKNGANRIHLSLSHEKHYAVAQVILEYV